MHNTFRHTFPGYIFLFCVISFLPSHMILTAMKAEYGPLFGLLIAGAPLGLTIHWIYRGLIYGLLGTRWSLEAKLQALEARAIRPSVPENQDEARRLTLAFWCQIHADEKAGALREWFFHSFSTFHMLGSSMLALVLAFAFCALKQDFPQPSTPHAAVWAFFWMVVLISITTYARETWLTLQEKLLMTISARKDEIEKLLGARRQKKCGLGAAFGVLVLGAIGALAVLMLTRRAS